jgi:16S rRNA (cytidine1402-2'-O)-methyltransferase
MKGGQPTPARQDTPPAPGTRGTLYIVATPIGNLEDITLRALRILREVDLVAAEDTRRTSNLLRHYQIQTPLLSLHEHNERRRSAKLLELLSIGRSIALVSDAGTPGIADPGAHLVAEARAAGFPIVPIPGPSAVTTALSASGLSGGHAFLGFPPVGSTARRQWMEALAARTGGTLVIFEAPHRIRRTLHDLATILGNQQILLGRELTKMHEEWLWGAPEAVADRLPTEPKGEFVILIPEPHQSPTSRSASDAEITHQFGQITETRPLRRRDAMREVARRLGLSTRAVYAALERHRNSVN